MNSMNFNFGKETTTNEMNISNATVYICGKCGNENELRPRDNILCKDCNGRIFYKKRTRKAIQFVAR